MYKMILDEESNTVLFEENPTTFKSVIKEITLSTLDYDYSNVTDNIFDTYILYAWLFYNCSALGLDVVYDVNMYDENDSKPEVQRLYRMLRNYLVSTL